MDSTSATMINSQVRHHGLPIYKQSGFILMMDALGTKEITERMDPSNYYIKWGISNYFHRKYHKIGKK